MQDKPTISANSHRIVEQKRYGSSNGSGFLGSGNVHQRLHQAAVAKQKATQRPLDEFNDTNQVDRASTGARQRWGSNGKAMTLQRSSSNMMPRGQYKVLAEQRKRDPAKGRSSSLQGGAGYERRQYTSVKKSHAGET